MNKWYLIVYAPAYNVEKSISEFLTRLATVRQNLIKEDVELRLILVDDASTDRTLEIIRSFQKNNKFVDVLSHNENQGPCNAILSGMDRALKSADKCAMGNTILIKMDADMEHQPEDIPKIIKPIISKKADVCIGYVEFDERNGLEFGKFNRKCGLQLSRKFLLYEIPQFSPGFIATKAEVVTKAKKILHQAVEMFRKEYSMHMITVDFAFLVIAKKIKARIAAIIVSKIDDDMIKKVGPEKTSLYTDYCAKTDSFLENFLKTI